ncbi:RhoGAP domain containing protein [Acanthamoeba castellanii str. Neff]|uniref:RhoGAP domain containing protein n=1 Tax=Acanthamoeba castellanii (strain ATCC 30010 / Neff) TaxID=1257118 RepID=L8H5K1_ACACF|nr:RhoGAP domain containing protein [Acanthamoeba castellanii str. Neff]ELR20003.1 RhoGAP domain containing protein [Acanthamoeba castellanii str. Neff]
MEPGSLGEWNNSIAHSYHHPSTTAPTTTTNGGGGGCRVVETAAAAAAAHHNQVGWSRNQSHNGDSSHNGSGPLRSVEGVLGRLQEVLAGDLSLQHALVDIACGLPSKEAREALVALVHVLHQKRKAHPLLKELISIDLGICEVEKMPPYSELTSKMLSEFCFLDNAKALEYIINPITAQMILSNASRVEVEPSRCATSQILLENQQTLHNTAQHFFRCLTTSLPLVSRDVKMLAAHLYRGTQQKFELSAEVRRGLALVTKLLQGIASETRFAEDSWMAVFNDFVGANVPALRSFWDSVIADAAGEDELSTGSSSNNGYHNHQPPLPQPQPQPVKQREMGLIAKFLSDHSKELGASWGTVDSVQEAKLASVENLLKELEAARDGQPGHKRTRSSSRLGDLFKGRKDSVRVDAADTPTAAGAAAGPPATAGAAGAKKKAGLFGMGSKGDDRRREKKEERRREKQQKKEREREEKEKKRKEKEQARQGRRKATRGGSPLGASSSPSAKAASQLRRAFGITLEETMAFQKEAYPDATLPASLTLLADAIIRTGGCKRQGLFRVSATQVSVSEIEAELNAGNYAVALTITEPHLAATLFKQWIRELAEPLIPTVLYPRCYDCIDSVEDSVALLSEVPELSRRVLRYIVRYLKQQILLPEVVETTRMDEDNIATIFAPSIFRQTGLSMADMVVTMNLQGQFLTNLLHGMHFPPWGSPDDEAYNPSASTDTSKSLLEQITDLLDDEIKELQEEHRRALQERQRDELRKQRLAEREKNDEMAVRWRMQRARVRQFGISDELKSWTLHVPRRRPEGPSSISLRGASSSSFLAASDGDASPVPLPSAPLPSPRKAAPYHEPQPRPTPTPMPPPLSISRSQSSILVSLPSPTRPHPATHRRQASVGGTQAHHRLAPAAPTNLPSPRPNFPPESSSSSSQSTAATPSAPGTRTCFACQQAIAGPAIRVASLGRLYHPQHFRECEDIPPPTDRRPPAAAAAAAPTCTTTATSSPSNGGGVVVHHLHRPTTAGGGPVPVFECQRCGGEQIAEGSFLRALGKIWHGHCFACAQCATPLLNDHFFEKQGRPYCSRHKW